LRGGQNVLDGGVGGHEQNADDEKAADERDGQAALGAAYFAGDHGEVVPSVVGPERGDERGHESADAADSVWQPGGEVGERASDGSETEAGDDQDQDHFQGGEDDLKIRGLLDAEIVESGNEPGDCDGEDLRPEQRHGAAIAWSPSQ